MVEDRVEGREKGRVEDRVKGREKGRVEDRVKGRNAWWSTSTSIPVLVLFP